MLKIIHNPRCSKSRQTLNILQQEYSGELKVIEYLKEGLSAELLSEIQSKLNKPISEFIRTKEEEYHNLSIDWKDIHAATAALMQHPKLLERPIVLSDNKAVIGRPPENVRELF